MNDDHHDHDHEENEHLFGFPYWHFFDIGSDVLRSLLTPLNELLEGIARNASLLGKAAGNLLHITLPLMRAMPVIGVAGEAMHVYTPFLNAREDWEKGKISDEVFGALCALYLAYTATGMGGILTAGAKEGLTYLVQYYKLMDERYIPHTLYKELQHAGILGGDDHAEPHHHHDAGQTPESCPVCTSVMTAPAHHHDHHHYAQAGYESCPVCEESLSALKPVPTPRPKPKLKSKAKLKHKDHAGKPHHHEAGGGSSCSICVTALSGFDPQPQLPPGNCPQHLRDGR